MGRPVTSRRKLASSDDDGAGSAAARPLPHRSDSGLRRVLWFAIAITGSMFLIETVAGHVSGSYALQADAVDFLDDSLAFALAIVTAPATKRQSAAAALLNSLCLCLVGSWILGSAVFQMPAPQMPRADIVGATALLAMAANAACLILLAPYRNGAGRAQSAWLHSRNDMLGNVLVLLTAVAVWLMQSPWPDLFVAVVAAVTLLGSAIRQLQQSYRDYRET